MTQIENLTGGGDEERGDDGDADKSLAASSGSKLDDDPHHTVSTVPLNPMVVALVYVASSDAAGHSLVLEICMLRLSIEIYMSLLPLSRLQKIYIYSSPSWLATADVGELMAASLVD